MKIYASEVKLPRLCSALLWPYLLYDEFHLLFIYFVSIYFLNIFTNIWFAIQRLNKCILYAKGLSKGTHATQSVKSKWNVQMKRWPRIRTWAVTCPRLMWITPYVTKELSHHTKWHICEFWWWKHYHSVLLSLHQISSFRCEYFRHAPTYQFKSQWT